MGLRLYSQAVAKRKQPDTHELAPTHNPLTEIDDGLGPLAGAASSELIRETIMRSGGEPFGRPYEMSLHSLTEKVVKLFRLKSFFGFEIFEKPTHRRNKFTRYGASRFFGRYDLRAAKRAKVERADTRTAQEEPGVPKPKASR